MIPAVVEAAIVSNRLKVAKVPAAGETERRCGWCGKTIERLCLQHDYLDHLYRAYYKGTL